jgi:hypothetical protein
MSEGIGPTTEERCPKHGAVIVKPPNSEPFCWPCSQPPAPDSLAPVEVGQTVATADTLNLDWHAPSEGAPSEADAMTPGVGKPSTMTHEQWCGSAPPVEDAGFDEACEQIARLGVASHLGDRDPKPSNTTLAIGSTWTGPDGTVYDVVAPELAARLVELGRLPDDWGGSEKPSSRTLEVAAYLLSRMAIRGHTEARLAPMADGGIAVRYLEGPRSARFDVCNEEGAIVLATREVGAERQVFAEMLAIDAIDAMVRFLAQPPASELDTLRDRVGELERLEALWKAQEEKLTRRNGVLERSLTSLLDAMDAHLPPEAPGEEMDAEKRLEAVGLLIGEAQSQLASAIAACEASRKARDEAVVDTERLEVQLDALTVHFGSIAASISRIVREHIVRTTGPEPALEGLGRIEEKLVEGGKAKEEVKRLKAQRAHAVGIVDQRDRELFDASRPDVDSLWVHRKTGRTVLVEMYGTEYQLRYRYLGGSRKSAWLNATTFHERFERKPKPAKRKAGR